MVDKKSPVSSNTEEKTVDNKLEKKKGKVFLNGECTTCTGFTYFSHAMSQNRSAPICIGYRQKRDVPPLPINIEAEAKKQVNPSVYEDSDFYFVSAGMTIYTPKMLKDGWAPLSIKGVAMCNISPIMKEYEDKNAGKSWNLKEDVNTLMQSPSTVPEAALEKSKEFGTKVINFWKRGLENYPEKYFEFSKKVVFNMEKTVVGGFAFAGKMFRYWVPES